MFDPEKDSSQEFALRLFDTEYWHELAPDLPLMADEHRHPVACDADQLEDHRRHLIREGYVHIKTPGITMPEDGIIELFKKLHGMGLPPVFAFVYDVFWNLSQQMQSIVGHTVGDGNLMLPDFWCWYVLPGESGFAPHRDKGPESLLPGGEPKWVTVWVPITEATPINSCMYVVPASCDPHYGHGSSQKSRFELSDIRALPGDAGDIFMWTQHLLHWGSRSAEDHKQPPRMSVAFEYQRADIPARDKPLMEPLSAPGFEQRLALIAKQILYYKGRLKGEDALIALAEDIKSRLEHTLDPLDTKL